jgi:hypothetical protein
LALVSVRIILPGKGRRLGKCDRNTSAGALILLLAFIAGNRWVVSGEDLFWLVALMAMANAGLLLWQYGTMLGDLRVAKISVLLPI